MSLTTDCFGRVKVTHVCPECRAHFLGPATCRPCPANGFAHEGEVDALPIVGCDPPPDITFVVALPISVKARDWEQAYEMSRGTIEHLFPKRIAERVAPHLLPVALEERAEVVARHSRAFQDQQSHDRSASDA